MVYVKPLLDKLQFAYLDKRSTDDAVNFLIHELAQHLDKPGASARCLYIDFSSAFNTMLPHLLIEKLSLYGVPKRLQLWVLDFLSFRKQYVRTEYEMSSMISISTGAPQGCVLSAVLFIIYTNDMCENSSSIKIVKYADDTAILGLISNNDCTQYMERIADVVVWCGNNCLDLNVAKTKEMQFDFRRTRPDVNSVCINNTDVDVVKTYKYLGVHIESNLKWDELVNAHVKKANKRLYHLRCLGQHTDVSML
jgi:hypothetical protein